MYASAPKIIISQKALLYDRWECELAVQTW